MRNISMSLLAVAAVFSLSAAACRNQAPLQVGAKAPALQVSRWVKGRGLSAFDAGKVYVVEFWATWCPPCSDSIPHITEMARAYKDRVTFVGVSVWEREPEETVDAFVRDMGDRMDYLVARDTAANHMAKSWLKAAGLNSLPSAFIVDGDGNIAWIGHPMDTMEKALNDVLSKANAKLHSKNAAWWSTGDPRGHGRALPNVPSGTKPWGYNAAPRLSAAKGVPWTFAPGGMNPPFAPDPAVRIAAGLIAAWHE